MILDFSLQREGWLRLFGDHCSWRAFKVLRRFLFCSIIGLCWMTWLHHFLMWNCLLGVGSFKYIDVCNIQFCFYLACISCWGASELLFLKWLYIISTFFSYSFVILAWSTHFMWIFTLSKKYNSCKPLNISIVCCQYLRGFYLKIGNCFSRKIWFVFSVEKLATKDYQVLKDFLSCRLFFVQYPSLPCMVLTFYSWHNLLSIIAEWILISPMLFLFLLFLFS